MLRHIYLIPPINGWAQENLYHIEAFDVFHYKFASFTKRENYHSFQILYTYDGKAELIYRNKEYVLQKDDIVFINCMYPHYYKAISPYWDVAVLHFNGPLLPVFYENYISNCSAVLHDHPSHKLQHILETLLSFYSYPDAYRDWKASNCIENMLLYLVELSGESVSKTRVPDDLKYLIRYMENNYTSHLTLDFLAEFASMSKYYLAKEFKKYTGFSPNDYLITLRINHAKLLLTTTTLPASKIAFEIGMNDINNFNNLFKKKTGMTPIQYRHSNM